MTYFTAEELILSFLYALVYGISYAAFVETIGALGKLFRNVPTFVQSVIIYDKLCPPSYINLTPNDRHAGLRTFATTTAFSIGFILLSYFALDGEVRLYTLIASITSFFIFKMLTKKYISGAAYAILSVVFRFSLILLRVILYPIRYIYLHKKTKNVVCK